MKDPKHLTFEYTATHGLLVTEEELAALQAERKADGAPPVTIYSTHEGESVRYGRIIFTDEEE